MPKSEREQMSSHDEMRNEEICFEFYSDTMSFEGLRVRACSESEEPQPPLSWAEVLKLWRKKDRSFTAAFRAIVLQRKHRDVFWECCPVSAETTDQPFECAVLDAQGQLCANKPSPNDFAEHLRRGRNAVAFPNLGHDAQLVAPVPLPDTPKAAYGHIAPFCAHAPEQQQLALWHTVSTELQSVLVSDPEETVWLSTDGRGVPWLHVRLDSSPKYIKVQSYTAHGTGPAAGRRCMRGPCDLGPRKSKPQHKNKHRKRRLPADAASGKACKQ